MRDDFSREVIDTLAKRVGYCCSNPQCGKPTSGPRTEPDKTVIIGVAAHIAAAAPGGPRYNPSQLPSERSSAENGIWLCQNCAKLIDNDVQRYPVEILLEWKRHAESAALSKVERNGISAVSVADQLQLGLNIEYTRVRIRSERHDYSLEVTIQNLGTQPIADYYVEVGLPTPTLENPQANALYVAGRSNEDVTLFRALPNGARLFPKDRNVVMSVPYYMDNRIFWNPRGLFGRVVTATAYAPGIMPVTVGKPFEELQCF